MLDKIIDGRTDLVFEFIGSGNSTRVKDSYGTSLIKWCAYYGDVSAIKFLLSKGEKINSLGSNLDLNGACFHGHWQLCQYLIESGADVNMPLGDTGESPLHAALCKANRPAFEYIIELLLVAGANPNSKTNPAKETGSFMRDCKTRAETPLHRAAAFGSEKSIELLLAAGADLKALDMNGDTPLSWASWYLRPPHILKKLCYGQHSIHSQSTSYYSENAGWGQFDLSLLGTPHI